MTCRYTSKPAHRVYYHDFKAREPADYADAIGGVIAWVVLFLILVWVL